MVSLGADFWNALAAERSQYIVEDDIDVAFRETDWEAKHFSVSLSIASSYLAL